MSIPIHLVSIGQSMNFETGVMANTAILRLPDGQQVTVALSDEDVSRLVGFYVKNGGKPTGPAASTPVHVPPPVFTEATSQGPVETTAELPAGFSFGSDDEGSPAVVFGAPSQDEAMDSEWSPPPPTPDPPANPQANVQYVGGKMVVPQRTVPKDDFGFPIVRGNGVDPASVLGPAANGSGDEDGVQQA